MGHVVLAEERNPDDEWQWDPLAPNVYRDAPDEELVDDAAPAPSDAPVVDDTAQGTAAGGGFADPSGIARVWMAEGRLTRVRISSNWRSKVAAEQVDLSDCVNAAIVAASLEVQDLTAPVEQSGHQVADADLIPISSRAEATRLLDEWQQRQQEAIERLDDVDMAALPQTRAHSAGATAVLDPYGRLMHVELSGAWLERADVTTINTHVVAAAANAYRDYVPAEQPAREELNRLLREHDVILASYLAWMNRGDWQ